MNFYFQLLCVYVLTFCYPLLDGVPQNTPYPRVAVFQKLLRSLAQSSHNKTNLNERSWGRNAWRTPKNVCVEGYTLYSGTYWLDRTYMAVLPRGILGIISFREYGLHVLNMVQCTWKPVNTDTKGTCYSVRITRGGGTPIHYLYGYVPPNGVVILKLLI